MRWRRLLSLIRKEFIQIKRDRRTLGMMIVIPFVWLLVFGYAASFDVSHISTGVAAGPQYPLAPMVSTLLASSKYFDVSEQGFATVDDLKEAIRTGKVSVGIVPPQVDGTPGTLVVDGSNLFTSQTALRQLQMLAQGLAVQQGTSPAIPFKTEILYNPDLRSANSMIPGLVGVVMVFIATIMTAMGVVRERERGTLEQLMVTPLSSTELMIGKIAPYVVISLVDLLIVVVAGVFIFDVPFAGNPFLLAGLSFIFLIACLGIGLLVSTVSQTQQQAMQLAVFTLLPQILISGFIFPLTAIPWGVRWIAYLVPLTYFLPICRGIFVKDLGMVNLWPYALILLAYAAAVIMLAAWRFRRRLV
ncbi:MAG: ABC transporter permease [Actinobacteria bacterium]|nr:ABC transporter permease [Actinomycetota bacterium]